MSNHFCCPNCGHKHLQLTTETDVKTTGKNYSSGQGCLGYLLLGPLGLLCGSCGQNQKTTTTNTNYWMCQNCGNKFRRPEDLKEEARSLKARTGIVVALAILISIMDFVIMMIPAHYSSDKDKKITLIIICTIVAVGIFVLAALSQTQANNKIQEADTMQKQMNSYFRNEPSYRRVESQMNNTEVSEDTSEINDWECECGTTNSSQAKFCINCGKGRVVPQEKPAEAMWQCAKCGNDNFAYARFCSSCGNSKQQQQSQVGSNEWQCPDCGKVHQNYVGTCGCGHPKI